MTKRIGLLGGLLALLVLVSTCAPAARDSMTAQDVPYDAFFIDSMIAHHQGAVEMAEQALAQAEQAELRTLAESILADQKAEIAQMQSWRQTWYPELSPTEGIHMDMGPMEVAEDATKPYDLRFIEAMIPHHEGAIAMAQDALENATRIEIRELAQAIIAAQEAEIAQMKQWRLSWYGE